MVVRIPMVDWDLQRLLLLVSRVRLPVGLSHLPVLSLHGLPRLLLREATGCVSCRDHHGWQPILLI